MEEHATNFHVTVIIVNLVKYFFCVLFFTILTVYNRCWFGSTSYCRRISANLLHNPWITGVKMASVLSSSVIKLLNVYLQSSQTSMIELFCEKMLTVWLGSKCVSDFHFLLTNQLLYHWNCRITSLCKLIIHLLPH